MEYAGKGPIMNFDEFEGTFSINDFYKDKTKTDPDNFTEDEVKDIIRGILSGLDYCKSFLIKNSTYTRNRP